MLTLEQVEKICDNQGSTQEIYITDPDNIDANLDPITPSIYYNIQYRKSSGIYTETSQRGKGGDYANQELSFFLPMRRAAVQTLIRRCSNRRISAFFNTKNGTKIAMINCRLSYTYTTGAKTSESEGYNITLKGVTLNNGYTVVNGSTSPLGNNLTVPGNTANAGTQPIGNDGVQAASDCCVTVQTASLLYVPMPTGNEVLKNMFVVGSDMNKYFIDSQGVRFQIDSDIKQYKVDGNGTDTVWALPWTVIDPYKDLLVFRNGTLSKFSDPLTDINQHVSDGSQVEIHSAWPLEKGEWQSYIKLK